MQELIEKLQSQHDLSAEQSHGILNTIKNYIQGKFPMLGGAIDNLFSNHSSPVTDSMSTLSDGSNTVTDGSAFPNTTTTPVESVEHHSSFLDKISDVIPGSAGEKIEDFTKKAADKISGFFEGNKKDA